MKKTGKALSLVLSLALVASSLTATFASAATAVTETLPQLADGAQIDLVNGASGKASTTDITSKLDSTELKAYTKDNLYASNLALDSVKVISGSNLITATYDSNAKTVKIDLNSQYTTGTAKIGVLYKATSYRYSNPSQPIDFIVEKDYPVAVHQLDAAEIVVTSPITAQPKWKTGEATVNIAGNVVVNKKATATNTDRFLDQTTKENISVPASDLDATKRATLPAAAADQSYFLTVSTTNNIDSAAPSEGGTEALTIKAVNDSDSKPTGFTVAVAKPKGSDAFNPGAVTLTATPVVNSTGTAAALNRSKAVSNSSVSFTDTVDLTGSSYDKIATWHGATFASATGTTWEAETSNGATVSGKTVNRPADESIAVTGSAVILDAVDTTMTNGSVGAVTVTAGKKFIINDGSVGDITGDATSGTGSIVTLEEGRIGNVVSDTINVNGGTSGTLTGNTVAVNTNDSKFPATVGAIKGTTVSVGSAQAAVTTGVVTLTGTEDPVESGHKTVGGTLTVSDSKTTIAGIDLTYYNSTIDAKGFVGSLPAPVNAAFGAVKTEPSSSVDTTALTFANPLTVSQLNVTNGTITLAAGGTVDTVIGSGTVIAPAAKLTVNDSFNTVNLKLSDKDIKAGDIAFYAKPYAAATVSPVGFTVDYDAANAATSKTAVTAYKIKDVSFAGVMVQPQANYTNEIVQKTTSVYEGVAYPSSTQLPTGEKVVLTFAGNTDNFTTKITNNVIAVTANKYDANFASQNKGTITATLVDANGVADPKYAPATYDVTILEKPAVAPTTFTTDGFPTTMKAGQQYQVKITSNDGTAPKVAFADGFAVVMNTTKSGNSTFVKFTAKVAKDHGVYVSGTKVAIIKVAGSICDTTTVTKKAGQPYTFKVTSPTNAAPTFVIGGIGAIKPVKVSGHDYFYKYVATANKGVHGVYVNGAVIALYTFA